MAVQKIDVPDGALLGRYASRADCFTDCYVVAVPGEVTLERLLAEFYRTPLFRVERTILRLGIGAKDTDEDVDALASGASTAFAAWTVEDRTKDEVLLRDRSGWTRSWFAVRAIDAGTEVLFGSAVTPPKPGDKLGLPFTVLLPFHKLYSRALLAAARRRLV